MDSPGVVYRVYEPGTVKPGTVRHVVRRAGATAVIFEADGEPNEPYILLGQEGLDRAKRGERGTITFTTGGPMGGWWRYEPEVANG